MLVRYRVTCENRMYLCVSKKNQRKVGKNFLIYFRPFISINLDGILGKKKLLCKIEKAGVNDFNEEINIRN